MQFMFSCTLVCLFSLQYLIACVLHDALAPLLERKNCHHCKHLPCSWHVWKLFLAKRAAPEPVESCELSHTCVTDVTCNTSCRKCGTWLLSHVTLAPLWCFSCSWHLVGVATVQSLHCLPWTVSWLWTLDLELWCRYLIVLSQIVLQTQAVLY